ncbi:DISARM system helicase DrmA [Leptolyngbya sp. GGD]|uniref:DISARM system helicase DrmA n=1 Tax=Leptolyngbya sp. GGD TaxID=2997907 RepID=UPI00227B32DE|nr:DISARM system helicase DrmA [Leptolyngbya sp. GGD]MCY6492306.1 DISARM system helicase DrmA [Leptolyngbya sp. GGD]
MKIIKLPAILPGNLNLEKINQQLRDRTAQLDWSAVVSASDQSLNTLLAGLDLSDDADVLGDSTLSETVASKIVQVLQEQPEPTKTKQSKPNEPKTAPAIWQQSNLLQPQFVATDPAQSEGQGTLIEMQFVPTASSESDLPAVENDKKLSSEATPVLQPPSYYQIRAELEEAVLADLLGPAGGEYEEVDEARVSDRYIVGLLAPLHRRNRPTQSDDQLEQLDEMIAAKTGTVDESTEQLDELAVGGTSTIEDGTTETITPAIETMFPSSLGMSFCVSGAAKAITIKAGWGQYDRTKSEYLQTPTSAPKAVWRRYPVIGQSPPIALKAGAVKSWQIDPEREVYVRGQIRAVGSDWIISLFLVNEQREPDRSPDQAWLFQPELSVESADPNHREIFIRKATQRSLGKLDPVQYAEEQAMEMLYRHQIEFAVGHGTGVHAELSEGSGDHAIRLCTRVVPAYEIPKTDAPTPDEIPGLTGLVLDMKGLAESSPEALVTKLNPLVAAYANWIEGQAARIADPTAKLQGYEAIATDALANCTHALERIQSGLELLQSDLQSFEAFQFMNRSMWQQRVHSLYAEQIRRGETLELSTIDIPRNRSWRPFQLAFILLNLPSITDLNHSDRTDETQAIADLLWFPTGGGKTEAYLGLTAYTIGLRRLQGTIEGRSGESGVAVLMRYTLRLLTLQQFQRATALICACEAIRREDPAKWGKEPFRIGLWVGQKTTPNRTEQSEEFLKQKLGQYQPTSSGSPHQLTNCPWCGSKIDPGKQNIKVESFAKGQARTLIYCGDTLGRCLFSQKQSPTEGLPILVVDEEIYRRLPTLLIATVDKFAQMPWNGAVQMLFGQVEGYCQRHGFVSPEIEDSPSHPAKYGQPSAKTLSHNPLRPPDLIIQDELHLISGPLGTLVGLYETAVDKLCSWTVNGKTVRPKVIASTATIRQARDQIHHLFLRQVQIFPPQGLDVTDNFFSLQREPSEDYPGRRYLGICATGRRLKAALIRVYTAGLAASQALYEKYGEAADPWMTMVGYFNSMRELGGTRRLVDDDIQSRLGKMDQRGLARRSRIEVKELTSRIASTDIPIVLDALEVPFNPNRDKKADPRKPIDVLLATNMISVGVDVRRLGAMVVTGQPKTTAEYIQATSRVGRTFPGIVFTVYNWARPRDLSHYEQFEHYHATFYKHVEALSVTPFAPRAIDRGLAALLVALVRLKGTELNKNDKAGRIDRNHPHIQEAMNAIVTRAANVEGPKTRDLVRQALEAKLDYWLEQSTNLVGGAVLGYQSQRDGVTQGLLTQPGQGDWQPFTCLNSLRNVEPTIGLILDDRIPDDDFRTPQPMPTSD